MHLNTEEFTEPVLHWRGSMGRVEFLLTSREGGLSRGPYESLNLGYHVGDVPERVRLNRERVRSWLPRGLKEPVVAEQIHGNVVRSVGELHAGCRWVPGDAGLAGVDGLLTETERLPLAVMTADCLSVVLTVPKLPILAVLHAGWRGVAGGILENAVDEIRGRCECPAREIRAWFGPRIGPCCYEVGTEVAEQFSMFTELHGASYHLDLAAAAASRLSGKGLECVEHTGACTSCEPSLFSHRRATRLGEPATGRQMLLAWIRSSSPG